MNSIVILNSTIDWINSQSMPEFAVLHTQLVFKTSISLGKGEMRKKSASINILFRVNSHFSPLVNRCKGFPKKLLSFCMGELGERFLMYCSVLKAGEPVLCSCTAGLCHSRSCAVSVKKSAMRRFRVDTADSY